VVRQNLGDKWIGEVAIQDQQPALGLSTPWWFYLLFGLGFVAFGLTILLAIGTFGALTGGKVSVVPPVAWLALLFWVVMAGGILFLYRKRG
jgi:4-amino-4-deoxy-L-arabinose transferase-like glycosyltransferase